MTMWKFGFAFCTRFVFSNVGLCGYCCYLKVYISVVQWHSLNKTTFSSYLFVFSGSITWSQTSCYSRLLPAQSVHGLWRNIIGDRRSDVSSRWICTIKPSCCTKSSNFRQTSRWLWFVLFIARDLDLFYI